MKLATLRSWLAAGLLVSLTPLAQADNWPQWRGPENNGHSKEKGLPTKFDPNTNLAWKLPLPGRGGSTPAVWGDHIFLTSMEGKDVVLLCVKTDGKLLWKKTVSAGKGSLAQKGEGDEASPSPSTDGKHVYVYTGTTDFACYDFQGNEIWKFNVRKRYGDFSIGHGVHITPLLFEDRLYFALLGNNVGHFLIATDKATGKEAWKAERPSEAKGESREAYTSPVLWQNGKDLNLVVLGCDYVTGHSVKDGTELWRLGDFNPGHKKQNHRIITSPVASPEALIVPTCRGLHVMGVKAGASGTIKSGSSSELWRIEQGAPDVSCPLVHDGVVYLPQSNTSLLTVDVKTGEKLYSAPLTKGRFRASPVFADGNVYLTGRDDGTVIVVKAGRKLAEPVKNVFPGENFTASPAIANGRIYLRGFNALYAISEGGK